MTIVIYWKDTVTDTLTLVDSLPVCCKYLITI